MPAERHEVVHAIVGFGNTGKDTSDALSLLRFGDGLEAEMGRPGRIGARILGDGISGIGGTGRNGRGEGSRR